MSNLFRYTGREYDEETGLYYFRARYYDGNNGRFLGVDPLDEGHLYSFLANNPNNAVDPGGLFVGIIQAAKSAMDFFIPPPPSPGAEILDKADAGILDQAMSLNESVEQCYDVPPPSQIPGNPSQQKKTGAERHLLNIEEEHTACFRTSCSNGAIKNSSTGGQGCCSTYVNVSWSSLKDYTQAPGQPIGSYWYLTGADVFRLQAITEDWANTVPDVCPDGTQFKNAANASGKCFLDNYFRKTRAEGGRNDETAGASVKAEMQRVCQMSPNRSENDRWNPLDKCPFRAPDLFQIQLSIGPWQPSVLVDRNGKIRYTQLNFGAAIGIPGGSITAGYLDMCGTPTAQDLDNTLNGVSYYSNAIPPAGPSPFGPSAGVMQPVSTANGLKAPFGYLVEEYGLGTVGVTLVGIGIQPDAFNYQAGFSW